MSLAVTPGRSAPSTLMAMVLKGLRDSVWVAMTCSTSDVPMPMASAPNAPCVEVCESPHTTVIPGWVSPSCGPTTCTMPLLGVTERVQADAELLAVVAQGLDLGPAGKVGDRLVDVQRRGVVVLGGDGEVRAAQLAAGQAETLECLRGGSPHGRGAGRCTEGQAGRWRLRRRLCAPRAHPRLSRPMFWPWPSPFKCCLLLDPLKQQTPVISQSKDLHLRY
jgi:hypothetical protein